MSRTLVAIIALGIIPAAIIGFDIWLYIDNVPGNSISQVIIWLTSFSPLVPFMFGFFMGALIVHWFEAYFYKRK
jgi:hypothetical protein